MPTVSATSFEQQHPVPRIGGKPVREHATSRSGADDDIVVVALMRPRLIGYAVALLAMMVLFAYAIYDRPLVKLDVLKDRVLYRENETGQIENVYTLKVMNKAQKPQVFVIEASGLDGLSYSGRREIQAAAGELVTVPVELSIDPEKLPSSTNEIVFHVKSADDPSINDDADSRFIGPSIR